jgi:hypothetical protein
VTAKVQPASIALKDFKPNKGSGAPLGMTEAMVSCTFENRTTEAQVINGYCTLTPAISSGDRQIILNDRGTDGTRLMRVSDIIVLQPGKKVTLKLRLIFIKVDTGVMILRYAESGEFSTSEPGKLPKTLDIEVTYANTLDKAAIEKIAPKLAGTKYTLVAEQKFPLVQLAITE